MRSSTMLDVRSFRRGLFLAAICVATILGVDSSSSRAGDFHLLTSSSDEAPIIRGADPDSRPSFLLLAQAELPAFDDQPSAPVTTQAAPQTASPVEPQLSPSVSEPSSPASSPTPPQSSAERSASAVSSSSATKADFSLLSPERRFQIATDASRPYRILIFTDPHCGAPCKTQEAQYPEFVKNGWQIGEQPISHLQIVQVGEKATPEAKSLCSKYLVESTPTLILISRDREVARRVGLKASTDGYGRRTWSAWTPNDLSAWMHANVEATRPSSGRAPAN